MSALRSARNQAIIRTLGRRGQEAFDAVHMHPVRREVADAMVEK